jgi:hypothetical protein
MLSRRHEVTDTARRRCTCAEDRVEHFRRCCERAQDDTARLEQLLARMADLEQTLRALLGSEQPLDREAEIVALLDDLARSRTSGTMQVEAAALRAAEAEAERRAAEELKNDIRDRLARLESFNDPDTEPQGIISAMRAVDKFRSPPPTPVPSAPAPDDAPGDALSGLEADVARLEGTFEALQRQVLAPRDSESYAARRPVRRARGAAARAVPRALIFPDL